MTTPLLPEKITIYLHLEGETREELKKQVETTKIKYNKIREIERELEAQGRLNAFFFSLWTILVVFIIFQEHTPSPS